jgi:hypothetical protein
MATYRIRKQCLIRIQSELVSLQSKYQLITDTEGKPLTILPLATKSQVDREIVLAAFKVYLVKLLVILRQRVLLGINEDTKSSLHRIKELMRTYKNG